jgi:tetratricopeptide (TPR) repeat protein
MAESTLASLDPRFQRQFAKAQDALRRRDYDYVINVSQSLLQQVPGCLEIRRALRQAQEAKAAGGKRGFGRLLGSVAGWRSGAMVKKDPVAAMTEAEVQLSKDPTQPAFHRLLGEAALACELPETAVFAFQSWVRLDPKSTDAALALGRALIAAGQPEEAVRVGEAALRQNAGHGELMALVKDASVAVSMARGNWEKEGDYRAKLADADAAVALEQGSRRAGDAEGRQSRRAVLETRVQAEGDRVEWLRELSQICLENGEFAAATDYLKRAIALPAGAQDTGLRTLGREIVGRERRARVQALREQFARSPEDSALQEKLAQAEAEAEALRREELEALVKQYPQDAGHRYALAEWLLAQGEAEEAALHFQRALQDPRLRISAQIGLAQAFAAGGKADLAIDQYEAVLAALPNLDDQKKSVLYGAAELYAQADRHEEAKQHLKTIYAVDLGYRDVASKLDAYYRS